MKPPKCLRVAASSQSESRSRGEEFSDDIIPALNELAARFPNLFVGDLDRLYVREVGAAVPGYVSRTLRLSGLAVGRKPNSVVTKHLAQAVRTYIFGFPLASIAISRGVLEQAVKECMVAQPEGASLSAWIEQIAEERGFDAAIVEMARSVLKAGNDAMHRRPMELSKAFDVLVRIRKILEVLYFAAATG